MSPSQRIILNALATYGRSVLGAGLALFSSRWVLNALGQTDFGLFTLVGSLIAFVVFLNNVLGSSVGRFLAFAIGKGDAEEVRQWFNTALVLHVILPVILVGIGWPVGEYCIRHFFVIPPARVDTCLWVFRLSLLSAFTTMLSIPFLAMFTAKQRIAETAFWGLLQSMLAFVLAYALTLAKGDLLLVYAAGMVGIMVVLFASQIARAFWIFPECRVDRRYWFHRQHTRELFHFAVWNLVGGLGAVLRGQGIAILLNLFHGLAANAAYGIANQVSNQTLSLTESMTGAMYPEITASAGRGDHPRVLELALRASKFGVILALLFTIPLLIEMDYLLTIWLKHPPPGAALFCQIILLAFLADKITLGHMLAVRAHGKIAGYQASVGVILLLTFPLAYVLLKLFHAPASALVAFLVTSIGCSIGRLYWGQHLLGLPARRWLADVLGRVGLVALPAAFLTAIPVLLLPASLPRLGLSLGLGILVTPLLGWLVGLTAPERAWFVGQLHRTLAKFGWWPQSGAST